MYSWADLVWPFTHSNPGPGFYRPLVVFLFALDRWVWQGAPWGYHLTNLLLHGLACALAYLPARQWLGCVWAAIAAAVLFALHPIHHEVVTWVSGRFDLLATVFCLAALPAGPCAGAPHRFEFEGGDARAGRRWED